VVRKKNFPQPERIEDAQSFLVARGVVLFVEHDTRLGAGLGLRGWPATRRMGVPINLFLAKKDWVRSRVTRRAPGFSWPTPGPTNRTGGNSCEAGMLSGPG